MPQDVADTGDCPPGDLRFPILVFVGKSATGFRQDLKISLYKLSGTPIRAKPLEVIPRNIRLDIGDSLENVTDIDRRVFAPSEHGFSVAKNTIPDGRFEPPSCDDIDPASELIL